MLEPDGTLNIKTAPVFVPLLKPARYKAAWGGRGSGKSHFFAELVVRDSATPGRLIVCIREVQRTLQESAKRLIERKLIKFGLGEAQGYRVWRDRIETPGDGMIMFMGLADHTAESIKSLEGYSRAWVEEVQTLSQKSLDLLKPTIREPGSQIWFSWNPTRPTDPVDAFLRPGGVGQSLAEGMAHNDRSGNVGDPERMVLGGPTDAIVVKSSWQTNPWWNKTLEQERLDCLRDQPDQYGHIWEGEYQAVASGAYYAADLLAARATGRISRVAADPLMTYRAFWDIGGTGAKADSTAIWIAQFVGREIRVLDYYEAQGQPLATHIAWLRNRGYAAGTMVLPHDGAAHDKVFAVSYETALQSAGFETQIVPNQGRAAAGNRIEAARRLFPRMWFNEDTCMGGLEALGAYHANHDEHRMINLGPCHDWSSHAADAFGMMCIAYEEPARRGPPSRRHENRSWLTM